MSLREQVTQPADPSYRLIGLTQGKIAIVDAADFEWLAQWKWYAYKNSKSGLFYAVRCVSKPKRAMVWMHRQIVGEPEGLLVDHKDGDTLNDRRSNLRAATFTQNNQNCRSRRNLSGFKGVSPKDGAFTAHIRVNGKVRHLGTFKSPEEAYEAYKRAALEFHGDFARFE